ncbi:Hsp20/alpha crystallin family protein [Alicyclobacillus vulcanalis]|uniref:Molecular chaperone IbpA, HSP20 family n=1 Tax=Alicyclobacillus vulcanalis TaxID=252246 RepID=A0A1N7NH54_9BACL|nr:Hsp20/alpha crystallin family protein [Alicyclobacillus vulcanalis]SIS97715.1 Molecular chaperone IbpA, HSP20 family [Alicyclobacillus vulcanalis]
MNQKSNHPFDFLNQLQELGDMRKWLGPDFFKNMPMPNFQGMPFFQDEPHSAPFPPIDLYNRSTEIVAVIALPGLKSQGDVSLSVRPRMLRVRGQLSSYLATAHDHVLSSELFRGPFDREVELPERVNPDGVKAVYRSGLLIVYMQKDLARETPGNTVAIDFAPEES